jgi:predicted transposase/invertase (TIGR01784 family)
MYFCLKNMSQLQERPIALTHGIFDKIFGISELLVMDEDTRDKIIENMTTERDLKNQLDYARKVAIAEGLAEGKAQGMEQGMAQGMEQGMEQGMAQGMAQEKLQIAKNMLAMGLDTETISKATGLSVDEIDNL